MHTKKSFPLLVFLVVLISSAFLTACGNGGTKPTTTIDVDMTDHKFTPDDFTVPAGAKITINLTNSGQQPHEFRILVFGAKVNEAIDKDRKSTRYWSTALLPGEKKSFTITAPSETGSYVIKCSSRGIPKREWWAHYMSNKTLSWRNEDVDLIYRKAGGFITRSAGGDTPIGDAPVCGGAHGNLGLTHISLSF